MNANIQVEKYTLFVDAQNIYNSVRQAFFHPEDSSFYGQIDFIKMAKLIESRCPYTGVQRQLNEIRLYTGRPSSRREPFAHTAFANQLSAWEKAGIKVIARPLRYLPSWPNPKAQQKGVDVEIAIDFIMFAFDRLHNVGVLASADTDLIPALELVKNRFNETCKIELVGIKGDNKFKRALHLEDTWCYCIDRSDYDTVADPTSYSKQEPHTQLNLPNS